MNSILLWVVVVFALGFDFTNGFHDTANAVATSVSTRALSPRTAVFVAAGANLAGAFVTTAVAKTIAQGIIDTNLATEQALLAALLGAIAWNLLTWRLGLPSSSTHALIGGLIGAALVQSGSEGVEWHGVVHKVALPALVSPALGFAGAFVILLVIYWAFVWLTPGIANRGFRLGFGAGRRGDEAALRSAVGHRGQHRLRLGADDPGCRTRRGVALLAGAGGVLTRI